MAEAGDDLYGASLDEFVARRDERARALRKEGKRDEAEEVKKLRKPTVAAWAVNMLARREGPRVKGLLDAGERLRTAHAKLLSGGPSADVQEASRAERKAVEELVDAAARILAEAGRSATETTLDRIRDTLHAAASDERVRELVRKGRVVEDEEATGFALTGLAPAAGPRPRGRAEKARPDPARERAEKRRRAAAERAAEARRELEEAERRVEEAKRALAGAEKEAKRRRSALERAERDLEPR